MLPILHYFTFVLSVISDINKATPDLVKYVMSKGM